MDFSKLWKKKILRVLRLTVLHIKTLAFNDYDAAVYKNWIMFHQVTTNTLLQTSADASTLSITSMFYRLDKGEQMTNVLFLSIYKLLFHYW